MSSQNAFGTFLETRELMRREGSSEPSGEGEASTADVQALQVLAGATFPASLPRLLEESGLGLDDFTHALERLKEANLVRIVTDNGQELAELTDQGRALKAQ